MVESRHDRLGAPGKAPIQDQIQQVMDGLDSSDTQCKPAACNTNVCINSPDKTKEIQTMKSLRQQSWPLKTML